ncbi:hypothetical protein J31TS4_02900 [Paenibacillus sp. J31TS4]|uniref:hypothetical protein n=1 Tax=Paenibacillus sp. J31TS4 TaxID=2807195 RepID=UPI001B108448|nr:hypothetical protein [Paenibacillus sp. J31TS4]GIP37010.1 hypothetical protein J31TS4_02900 [Paenibacillus sp. J31TS4]
MTRKIVLTIKEKLMAAAALFIALFGFIITCGSIAGPRNPGETFLSNAILTILVGLLPMALGIWLFVRTRRIAKQRRSQESEKEILRYAQEKGGRITAAELALLSSYTPEAARIVLESCTSRGFCARKIAENGTFVYEFPELLSEEEKRSSKHVFEA